MHVYTVVRSYRELSYVRMTPSLALYILFCVHCHYHPLLPVGVSCPALPPAVNARIAYSAEPPYAPTVTATYSCNTGYGPNGGGVLRTCANDGTWNGDALICNRKYSSYSVANNRNCTPCVQSTSYIV